MANQISENKFLNPKKILVDHLLLGYGMRVADLGCGAMAYFSTESAKLVGDQGTAYAVDVLKDVLSSVESRARVDGLYNLKTVWSDLERYGATKIPENSLDAALLVNTLFQMKNQQEAIREACRLTKPGGKLLIIDWKPQPTAIGPNISIRLDPGKLIDYAQNAGFTLMKEFEAGIYHYGLVFIK